MTLTPAQLRFLTAIRNFAIRRGRGPSVTEAARDLAVTKVTVHGLMVELLRKQAITVTPRNRRQYELAVPARVTLPDQQRSTKFPVIGWINGGEVCS